MIALGITPIDRSIMRFVTFQLFALIYMQKLAVPWVNFGQHLGQINISMLVMILSLGWMVTLGRIGFSPVRLGCYMMFVAFCLISQILVGNMGSLPSLIELLLLCAYMTVSIELPESAYLRVLDRFIKMMIVPAIIILCQYGVQKVTGQRNPISMNKWMGATSTYLYHGYFYEAGYPVWNAPFTRPNGFFFLEPSFASMFAASAAIIEITYFRRPFMLVLMVMATVLTFGGTGMTMLLVAAPFLLARENPRFILGCLVVGVVGFATAYVLNVPLPLIDRMGELQNSSASGADRLTVPATQLVAVLFDRTHVFGGIGAGATPQDFSEFGSAWPVLKVINEYGLLAMCSFAALYALSMVGNFNVPLKVAVTIIYQFTGGYLLSPVMLEFIVLLCVIEPIVHTEPARSQLIMSLREYQERITGPTIRSPARR